MSAEKSAEKPKAKKGPSLKTQLDTLAREGKSFFDQSMLQLTDMVRNWRQYRDIPKNNYALGIDHLRRGNIKDAIVRFRFVLWLEPGHADAWYYLGRSYLADGNKPDAHKSLAKALSYKPGNDEIIYLLAVAGGAGPLPTHIPLTLAREHFDSLAPDYNNEQLENHHYAGHTLLASALRLDLKPGRTDHIILELGTGTGLVGPLLRDIAVHITGIDLSEKMLAEAAKLQDANGKKTYDALAQQELSGFLPTALPAHYDIVLSAGLFSYIGALDGVFAQVSRILKQDGLFAFTADKMEEGGVRFDPASARFLFSQDYLRQLAEANGFRDIHINEASVYPAYPAWVCVFRK